MAGRIAGERTEGEGMEAEEPAGGGALRAAHGTAAAATLGAGAVRAPCRRSSNP